MSIIKKNCKRCGKDFEAQRHLKRYCSDTCRQYAYLERNGLRIEAISTENSISKVLVPVIAPPVNGINEALNGQCNLKTPLNSNEIPSDQLIRLMQEIKELRQQVQNNQKAQIPPDRSFQELLNERMKTYFGENMFTRQNFPQYESLGWSCLNNINERLKCFLKILLKFHKDGKADFSYLKKLYESLAELQKSFHFKYLPKEYPYLEKIANITNRLKNIVDENEGENEIEFQIRRSIRVEIKAMILEIGNTVPDADHCPPPKKPGDFSQNRYYQAAIRKGYGFLQA